MKGASRTLHLWLGLIFGSFFVVLGLTGSAIAWIHELDSALNPDLLQVAPPPGMTAGTRWRLAPATIEGAIERLQQDPRYGRPSQLTFPEHAGEVFVAWYRPAPASGSPFTQEVTRQVMLDPTTLAVTGERNWGEAGLTRPLLMPTVYHLHRYLVAGDAGKTIVGIFGLGLLVVSISGLIVWWPKLTRSAVWNAITVRHGGSWPRFSFRLHRAAGFFAAPVLLTMGFSGSYFNLPTWVVPALNVVAPVTPASKIVNRSKDAANSISPGRAVELAQAAFPQARASRLSLPAKPGVPYEVRVRQPGEVRGGDGATRVSIDSGDGAVLRVSDPLRARGGDKFVSWLFPLHSGEAFGTAGRLFISLFGMAPLAFFITGLVVWSTRRSALALKRAKAGARA